MSNGSLQVGDKVRIGTREEFEAYVEAGGDDLKLLICCNVAFGEVGEIQKKIYNNYYESSGFFVRGINNIHHYYFYPEEMLFLV